ncbi:unnamed protein product [Kluyveromyces dobzhanskii CBS 2104]|uniref:Signal peptidase subunit 3 n=1 Tax=Kluyveromyces dobzhanskii CBS 2104 TaxID=1427455 RepID=A0A0A8L3Y7_9SACH|nr:unnamed protein product [Kluyveromyces dobzhanskii CBS 2104]
MLIAATSWLQLHKDNAFELESQLSHIRSSTRFAKQKRYGGSAINPIEVSKVRFNADVDLSPLFNWNTKQVFAYITAEYEGDENPNTLNEITIWDKIIPNRENANVSVKNTDAKYQLWDLEPKLSERPLTFKLNWNVQPWFGFLLNGETLGSQTIELKKPVDQQKKKNQTV